MVSTKQDMDPDISHLSRGAEFLVIYQHLGRIGMHSRSWILIGNRKTRKHPGTPEKADFDFRPNNGEDSVLFPRRSTSSSYKYTH